MRATVSSLSRRLLSTFFAATLVLGLVPAAAFADDASGPIDADSVESSEEMTIEGTDPSIDDADGSTPVADAFASGEDVIGGDATTSDDLNLGTPILVGDIINQEMPLSTVAQAESTRSYFLAQTLESTKTVPVVSAKLPLDSGADQGTQAGADGGQIAVGSEDKVTDGDLPTASTEAGSGDEAEGGEDSDESDLGGAVTSPGVAAESTVVGAFEYLGMTFAVEPGGESVALVAVDYSKLPDEFVQKQIIVIPDMATPDELDYYSVTRIADNAFASLTKETANPDHTGCIELFSDEELLAEAGISQEEVQEFLDAEPVENDPIEPSDEIRTIVSMDGNVATLDDGSTYTFTNPLAGCAGILALGIPASVSSIGDDAFSGFETLQYLVVSDDNPEFASYDGALYSADLTNLRLIPEGRVGAVRVASSATSADPEVFSHCPSVDALVADAESVEKSYGIERKESISNFNDSLFELFSVTFKVLKALPRLEYDLVNGAEAMESHLLNGFAHQEFRLGLPSSSPYSSVIGKVGYQSGIQGSGFVISDDMIIDSYPDYTISRGQLGQTNAGQAAVDAWVYSSSGGLGMRYLGTSVFQVIVVINGVKYEVVEATSQDGSGVVYNKSNLPGSGVSSFWMTKLVPLGGGAVVNVGGNAIFASGSGGSIADSTTFRITSGTTSVNIPKATPNNTYTFTGWTLNVKNSSGSSVKTVNIPTSTIGAAGGTWTIPSDCQSYRTDSYTWNFTANFTQGYKTDWVLNNGSATQTTYTPTSATTLTFPSGYSLTGGPVRAGWTFDGWYTSTSYTTKLTSTTAPKAAVTYYARWKCDFTWDVNGGSGAAPTTATVYSPTSGTVTSNTAATVAAPAAPTAPSGWTFYRWSTSSTANSSVVAAGGTASGNTTGTGTKTYYARWQATVSWNANGGGANPASDTVYAASGTNMTATYTPSSKSEGSRTGYTFKGWQANGTSANWDDETGLWTSGSLTVSGATTMMAKWQVHSYTVTFANAGSNKPASETKTYEQSITLPSEGTYPGYAFKGWQCGSTTYPPATTSIALSSLVTSNAANPNGSTFAFTAVWDKSGYHLITLSDKLVSANDAKAIYYWPEQGYVNSTSSTTVVAPNAGSVMPDGWTAPSKDGYTFMGYYTAADSSYLLPASGAEQMITAAGVLTAAAPDLSTETSATTWWACYEPNVYSVTYRNASGQDRGTLSGGSPQVSIVAHGAAPGSSITLPAISDIARGYEFTGFTSSNATVNAALAGKGPGDTVSIGAAAFDGLGASGTAFTIEANYAKKVYSIAYDSTRYKDDGSAVAGVADAVAAVTYDVDTAAVTLPTAPTINKAGYEFKGWKCADLTGNAVNAAGTSVNLPTSGTMKDYVFTAVYALTTYTVTIDTKKVAGLNGGLAAGTDTSKWVPETGDTGRYVYTYDVEDAKFVDVLTLPLAFKDGCTFNSYVGGGAYIVKSGESWQFNMREATESRTATAFACEARYDAQTQALTVQVQLDDEDVQDVPHMSDFTDLTGFTASFDVVNGGELADLSANVKPGYVFCGWTAVTADGSDPLVAYDDAAGKGDAGWLHAAVKPGLVPGHSDAPTAVTAHFTYRAYPLYLVMGDSNGHVSSSHYAEVDAAEKASAFGADSAIVKDNVRVYKYADNGGYRIPDGLSDAGIEVPVPTNQGMTFAGWTDSEPAYASEFNGTAFKPTASITSGAVSRRVLTAGWTAATYTITFTNNDHVNRILITDDAGTDLSISGNTLSLTNEVLARGVNVTGIEVDERYYTAEAFKRFRIDGTDVKVDAADGWSSATGGFTSTSFSIAYSGSKNNVPHYFPNDVKTLSIALEFYQDGEEGPDGPVTAQQSYTARIDLSDGSYIADENSPWSDDNTVTFTNKTSGTVKLPVVKRYGYTFDGWTGAYDAEKYTADELNALPALSNNGLAANSKDTLPVDAIYHRVYTPTWKPATAVVKFADAATPKSEQTAANGYSGMPGGEFPVTFGQEMNHNAPNLLGRDVPTRNGYRFVGFFDTSASSGGQCYYGPDLQSAQPWNKDDGASSYTLYARWTKVDDSMYQAGGTVPADANAKATFSAVSKKDGKVHTGFSAVYTGLFLWDTYDKDSAYPAPTDTVSIALNTYTMTRNDSFDIRKVPSQFDYTEGSTNYRLLGFSIVSGKNVSYIPFTDLLLNNGFQLKVLGNHLVSPTAQPTFELSSACVTPVYTTGDPGYEIGPEPDYEIVRPTPGPTPNPPGTDDPDPLKPVAGDTIATLFNAGAGEFKDGSTLFTRETVWSEGAKPAVPNEQPTRTGYDFIGWSLSETHEGDACTCSKTDTEAITSRIPVMYYAHYAPRYSNVTLVEWSEPAQQVTKNAGVVYYGEYVADFTTEEDAHLAPDTAAHEGYLFKGYFDESGTVQYISSAGKPVRLWDRVDESQVKLYAKWDVDTSGGSPIPPTPEPPVSPDDPFPGVDDPHRSVPTNPTAALRMPVENAPEDGLGPEEMLYDGTYDGVMKFTVRTDDETIPASNPAAHVQLSIYSYEPAAAADDPLLSAHAAHERVRKAFEDWALDQGREAKYLQGFRVVSTGWAISLRDLHEGKSITVQCMGSDLEWTEGDFGEPPAASFVPGSVVAVWSTTPVIDPGYEQWPTKGDPDAEPPVPATQVWNRFDAGVGRFPAADGTLTDERMQTVASDFGGALKVPASVPQYPYKGYVFEYWYAFDANGNEVKASDIAEVDWDDYQTFYAYYERKLFDITLDPGAGKMDGVAGTVQTVKDVWENRAASELYADFAKLEAPTRQGYWFAGWYYYPGGEADYLAGDYSKARPYYVTDEENSPNNDANLRVSLVKQAHGTLYPVWVPQEYKVVWHYNYNGKTDAYDVTKETVTWSGAQVRFGQEVPAFPEPDTPRYEFYGWYTSEYDALVNSDPNRKYDAIVGEGKLFLPVDGEEGTYLFNPPASNSKSTIDLYAGWGKPVPYTIKLYAGPAEGETGPVAPTFSAVSGTAVDASGTVRTINIPYTVANAATGAVKTVDIYEEGYEPNANAAGWKFAGWTVKETGADFERQAIVTGTGDYEFVAKWAIADDGEYEMTFLKGDEVASSDLYGADGITWAYEGADAPILTASDTVAFDATAGSVKVPQFARLASMGGGTDTVGYTFGGWQRVKPVTDENGQVTGYEDVTEGSSFTTIGKNVKALDRQELVNAAYLEGVQGFVFRAVWNPRDFEIRYWMKDDSGEYVQMDPEKLDASSKQVAYDENLTLPLPAFQEVGSVFRNWDGKDFQSGSNALIELVPGETRFTVRDVVDLVMKVDASCVSSDGDKGVLDLYGATTPGLSFAVPTEVLIAFDPDRPEDSMIAGEAKLAVNPYSGSSEKVRVESVQVDLLGDADEAFGADGGYGGATVDLLVQAYHESTGEPEGDASVRMNLGASGRVYHASQLSDGGFDEFARGDALMLKYRLARTTGAVDTSFSAFRNLLDPSLQNTDDVLRIAKLYYTVGLAT